nr:serine/threonine-protein kinase 19 isoform X1 [Ipomoea batatas]
MEETALSRSSGSRKRQREPESDDSDQSLSLEDNLTFSDTMVALRIMRAQFPHIEKVSIQPFVLQSQLYSSVKDRTQVDRELESLKREKALRVFKLNTGQDDHAIMLIDDYLSQIERVIKRMEEKKQDDLPVFEWFKTHVISSKLDPSIGHDELGMAFPIDIKT